MLINRGLVTFHRDLKLRNKLVLSYIFLIVIPILVIGVLFYDISSMNILGIAQENVFDVLRKNNQMADQKLEAIEENALALTIDNDLFSFFKNINSYRAYDSMQSDKVISRVLMKYFPQSTNLYSANIFTGNYTYGKSILITPDALSNSELFQVAKTAKGKMEWIPTYNMPDMFKEEYLKRVEFDESKIFSAVQVLNPVYINPNNSAASEELADNIERPVLLINFLPDFFESYYGSSITISDAFYCISDNKGNIIAHSDKSQITCKKALPWLKNSLIKKSDSMIENYNDREMVICYDTSEITGWVSAIAVPTDQLLYNVSNIKFYIFIIEGILLVVAALAAYFISRRITMPINKLVIALKKIGDGKFNSKINVTGNDEIGYLTTKFNEMDDRIQILIEETYKSKIREKEMEIAALNTQINPHFLYNTLNIINLEAIENNQNDISKMLLALSGMLRYTVQNKQEMVDFRKDIEWLANFTYIMTIRYEGNFTVSYDISPELDNYTVPKLFLQPFVENSIIHGLSSAEAGGKIQISGWIEGQTRFFCVEDNGIGMEDNKIKDVMNMDSDSIGIANVNKRIKLLYGLDYGVQITSQPGEGTKVIINLPY